jgi:hypothetical protein
MNPTDSQLKRILAWNRFWLAVLLLALLSWGAVFFIRNSLEDMKSVAAHWDGKVLRLAAVTDGPFVVTHLATYGANEGEKATAVLSEPIAIIDSKGASMEPTDWDRLIWRSAITGEKVAPPPVGTPIIALYHRPLTTR